jgi:hypothetical protein
MEGAGNKAMEVKGGITREVEGERKRGKEIKKKSYRGGECDQSTLSACMECYALLCTI